MLPLVWHPGDNAQGPRGAPVPLDTPPTCALQTQHRTLSLNVPTGGCPSLRGTPSLPLKVQT